MKKRFLASLTIMVYSLFLFSCASNNEGKHKTLESGTIANIEESNISYNTNEQVINTTVKEEQTTIEEVVSTEGGIGEQIETESSYDEETTTASINNETLTKNNITKNEETGSEEIKTTQKSTEINTLIKNEWEKQTTIQETTTSADFIENIILQEEEYTKELIICAKNEVDKIINKDMNDAEKVATIYNYILYTVKQFEKNITTMEELVYYSSGLSAFKEGCIYGVKGYAMVFYHMAKVAGLDVLLVESEGDSYYHCWNQVKVDGIWYNLDAYADDGGDDDPQVMYLKFLISDKEFYSDSNYEKYIPTSEHHNCAESYDREKLIKNLSNIDIGVKGFCINEEDIDKKINEFLASGENKFIMYGYDQSSEDVERIIEMICASELPLYVEGNVYLSGNAYGYYISESDYAVCTSSEEEVVAIIQDYISGNSKKCDIRYISDDLNEDNYMNILYQLLSKSGQYVEVNDYDIVYVGRVLRFSIRPSEEGVVYISNLMQFKQAMEVYKEKNFEDLWVKYCDGTPKNEQDEILYNMINESGYSVSMSWGYVNDYVSAVVVTLVE